MNFSVGNLLSSSDLIGKKSILVYVVSNQDKNDISCDLDEFMSLALSAGMQVLDVVISRCKVINPKYFIGMGKILTLKQIVKDNVASVVLFSCALHPNQERNLICLLQCKILDRNQLILSIFAQRARSYEGKLQVKLAQLRYLNSRLTHEWNHLERQKGGIGVRGGPGETQLESDRRLLRKQMNQILLDLKKIENQRKQSRRRRLRIGIPTVALVGYTNAGKSTLFNMITKSEIYTEKKFFTTLDPTFRRIEQRKEPSIILVDTVGFIQNLPVDLISSFKSTLQEINSAELILHVVDASNEEFKKKIDVVSGILNDIKLRDIPTLLVMNKIDRIKKTVSKFPYVDYDNKGNPIRVWTSAYDDSSILLLKKIINDLLSVNMVYREFKIPMDIELSQKLYRTQIIQKYKIEDNCVIFSIYLSYIEWCRLVKNNKLLLNYIV